MSFGFGQAIRAVSSFHINKRWRSRILLWSYAKQAKSKADLKSPAILQLSWRPNGSFGETITIGRNDEFSQWTRNDSNLCALPRSRSFLVMIHRMAFLSSHRCAVFCWPIRRTNLEVCAVRGWHRSKPFKLEHRLCRGQSSYRRNAFLKCLLYWWKYFRRIRFCGICTIHETWILST